MICSSACGSAKVLEALDKEDPQFFDDGRAALVALYRELGMEAA